MNATLCALRKCPPGRRFTHPPTPTHVFFPYPFHLLFVPPTPQLSGGSSFLRRPSHHHDGSDSQGEVCSDPRVRYQAGRYYVHTDRAV